MNIVTPTNGVVRPEWFEGTNTTTDHIQEAIDLATDTGAKVLLEPRVYNITSTLHIYTATVLEGTICGALDRSRTTGTKIIYNGSGSAMDFNCINGDDAKNTCYRFKISNLSVSTDTTGSAATGLKFRATDIQTSPRHGLIENVIVNGFNNGIDIEAISYVTFRNLSIDNFSIGINISKQNNELLEFAYFKNIIMNRVSGTSNTIGINVKSGNNLYFDCIDINDCGQGFAFVSTSNIYNIFVQNTNITRCIKCIYFEAGTNYMARFSFRDISIHYPTWPSCDSNTIYAGFWFNMPSNYEGAHGRLTEGLFQAIFDSDTYNDSKHYFLYVERYSGSRTDVVSGCSFYDMRVLNPVYYNNPPRRFGIINANTSGTVTINSGSNSAELEIMDRTIFPPSLLPNVIVSPETSATIVSANLKYTNNKTFVVVKTSTTSSQRRNFSFFIPFMS